eukprot:1580597-Pyramimonas_sp.AAC.1
MYWEYSNRPDTGAARAPPPRRRPARPAPLRGRVPAPGDVRHRAWAVPSAAKGAPGDAITARAAH